MKKALWFSGGKDSLACLYMLRKEWDNLVVLWANTGKNFPEVLSTIDKVRNMVPHFVEVKSDKDANNEQYGLPANVVPIKFTNFGGFLTGQPVKYPIQSYLDCCRANIATPLFNWCLQNGITEIVKGQRNDEGYVSPSRDGAVLDGITFRQPIENWTEAEVLEYLAYEMDEMPEHLFYDHSSMDCYDCTAFLEHSGNRVELLKSKYPVWYGEFQTKLGKIVDAVNEESDLMKKLTVGEL